MSARLHYPVMLPEVLSALALERDEYVIDGTFGFGGYSEAILRATPRVQLLALDQDPDVAPRAAELKQAFGDRFDFKSGRFSDMEQLSARDRVDAIVLDIGVSSMQIDQALRGFSFQKAGPLDMRMGQSGPTAADAVNLLSKAELAAIFSAYGEERRAGRCADFILRARDEAPIETTDRLAEIIASALGRSGKIHPATRVFQALRIFINDELGELHRALHAAERLLAEGGRLVVVTFHSLEDRIVKAFLRRRTGEVSSGSRHLPPQENTSQDGSFALPFRSAQTASRKELSENIRSRSAKLRCAIRTVAPVWPEDDFAFSHLPQLSDLARRVS